MCLHPTTKTIETRQRPSDVVYRRLECLRCGERFNTFELSETVVRAIGMRDVMAVAAKAYRARGMRAQQSERRARVEDLVRCGWKPAAIAHEMGITDTRVRQIRTEMAASA